MFRTQLEQISEDANKVANAARDISYRIDFRVRKGIQPTDKVKKKTTKKSKGIAEAKPFPSLKPHQPTTPNATSQATPNSAVGSQAITSKDISDISNTTYKSSLNYSL